MNQEGPWTVYRTRFVVRARQLTQALVFTDALGREQSGRTGDYLVETSQGCRRITPRELFEDIYVPLEQQESKQTLAPHPARRVSQSPESPRMVEFRSSDRRAPARCGDWIVAPVARDRQKLAARNL